ncbi:hypothetical protein IJG89_01310 [Candidatus Saccharibacteria bacterium]|nr:hypothetical protein [Candidatus Saccharibacteria bacterium]
MKKTPKKILGILGLLLVAVTTVFAASLPFPSASAANSVVDTIIVRVIGTAPMVDITKPSESTDIAHDEQVINYNYENISRIVATLEYVDRDGNPQIITLTTIDITDDYGGGSFDLNMSGFDYGDYVLKLTGDGVDGLKYEDAVTLSYYPVTTVSDYNDATGDTYINLDYDLDDEDIDILEINVYDENGNLVTALSPIKVKPGTTRVELPVVESGIPSGKYTIKTTAYDASGKALYKPYVMYMNYKAEKSPEVPNTGNITFGGLNISQTDYLVTGLIVFFLTGFAGLYFVTHSKKDSRKKR